MEEVDVFRLHEVVHKFTGEIGSLCFVVRRPGWFFCREQALTLSVLAAHFGEYIQEIPIFGVVKETGVDDAGLAEFAKEYFPFPLYRDQDFALYRALGNRTAPASYIRNPFFAFHVVITAWHRLAKKQIGGNMKGEGIVQGGIIIFNKRGSPIAMYQEETGLDLPVVDLVNALETIRRLQEN